jgi:hypothetical protein
MARCIAALLAAASLSANAAAPLKHSEQAVINFGFATQLGSGIYSVSGRTLQVYRLPFGYTFPADDESRYRTRLTLPVTLGFVDFRPRDVADNGLPERVDSLSFVPGVAVDVRMRENWTLEPFVEAGVARDRSNEIDQRVFAIGLRSMHRLQSGATDWEVYEELVHAAVRQQALERTDDFTRLRIGGTARRPFQPSRSDRRPDYLAYAMVDIFSDFPTGPADARSRDDELIQFEFGLTFGMTEQLHLWRIPLPRIGIGYRFGEDLAVYRLVFGSPY